MFAFLFKFKTEVRDFIETAGTKLGTIEAKVEAEFAELKDKVEALFEAKKAEAATAVDAVKTAAVTEVKTVETAVVDNTVQAVADKVETAIAPAPMNPTPKSGGQA